MKRLRGILTAPFRAAAAAGGYIAGELRSLTGQQAALLAGLVLLGAGLGFMYAPLALAVPGAILVGVALNLHVPRGKVAE